MVSPLTLILTGVRPRMAGPCTTPPSEAWNAEPWFGQTIRPFFGGLTMKPWCVQWASYALIWWM